MFFAVCIACQPTFYSHIMLLKLKRQFNVMMNLDISGR